MPGSTYTPEMSWIAPELREPIHWKAVLIVDDTETDRISYQRYLSKILPGSCTILERDSGEEALLTAQSTPLDLIILDYRLPDMTGLELMALLAERCEPLPPVIMLTGQGNETVAVQAMKQGVMDYLTKGELTAELLARTVSRVYTQQQLQLMVQKQQLDLQDRAHQLEQVNTILRHTSQLLQARNQELDDFAYIASHDLKAPLRAISNLSQWLEEDLADQIPEPHRQQLQLLRARVIRMESLIEGVLQYSRLGRQEINQQPINTSTAIREVIDSLDPPDTVEITLPPQSYLIESDKLLLQRVLSNLISNAIKYHHRTKGHIHIDIIDQGSQLQFSVCDDGPGINPEFHQRIFGLFQTLQSRDRVESTGIGLTIVKKIVERQGGTIGLESQLGKGSTFWFTWPKG